MNIPRLCGDIPDEACTDFLGLFDGVWESKYTAIRSNFEKVLSKRVKGLFFAPKTRWYSLRPDVGAGYNTSSEEKAIHDGIGEGDSNPTTKYRPPRVGRWTVSPVLVRLAILVISPITPHRNRWRSSMSVYRGEAVRRLSPTATKRVAIRRMPGWTRCSVAGVGPAAAAVQTARFRGGDSWSGGTRSATVSVCRMVESML